MSNKAVLIMMTDVPVEMEADYHRWYEEQHIPEILAIPGITSARRFKVVGEGVRFMALYELVNAEVASSDPFVTWRSNSRTTDYWASKFTESVRVVYEQTYPVDPVEQALESFPEGRDATPHPG